LQAQGGAIVEVNAGPGLLMHIKPAVGAPRPVGQAIVEHLFPEADNQDKAGRIPIVGVAGSQGTNTIARLVAWLLHLAGHHTGLACQDGLFLDHRRVEARDSAHWEPARRLLMNQMVEAAVVENGAETILRDGLAYDRCTVGVVTDMEGAQALGHYDIQDADQLPRVLRTQVDVVLPDGVAVLNAADARVAALAPLCDGSVILYAQDADLPAIAAHRAAQGRAVFVRDGRVVLATGGAEKPLGMLAGLLPAEAQPDLLLAAVATAWALDIAPDLIAAGVKTFDSDAMPARTTRSESVTQH
ncbi:MAG TPA: cyanophycin synthetase, partial [Burkholderiaceae bacterium]